MTVVSNLHLAVAAVASIVWMVFGHMLWRREAYVAAVAAAVVSAFFAFFVILTGLAGAS